MALPPLGVDPDRPILKKSKIPTGIRDLDVLLEGGYVGSGSTMILGPTGMEKMSFAFQYAAAGIARGDKVFYICADSGPDDIINKAAGIGIDLKPSKNIKFIDCYTSTLGNKSLPPESPHLMVPGPSALNDLSLAINEAIKESAGIKLRIVFHSLSSFMLYNPKDSLVKFLQVVGGRLKNADASVLMLVEDGMHEKQLLSTVEYMMDEKFTLHDKGGAHELELNAIGAVVPIKISTGGVTIV
jgi:KaiC/GvpD/RAD55 family RecA-like ATPase